MEHYNLQFTLHDISLAAGSTSVQSYHVCGCDLQQPLTIAATSDSEQQLDWYISLSAISMLSFWLFCFAADKPLCYTLHVACCLLCDLCV